MRYPDYVKQFRPKGTVVKKINGTYYAYYATSKRVPEKKYPVQVVEGIAGKIDEMGFHPVTRTRIEIDSVDVRECGFTNYMLLFEELYMVHNRRWSRKDARIIYRSLIVYLSNNSYLNDDPHSEICTPGELVDRYGIGIPNQLKAIGRLIECDLGKLEQLKYICNVRVGDMMIRSSLTDAQRKLLEELDIDEKDIR